MRIVYLASARRDFHWFKTYYIKSFPEGRKKADASFLTAQKLLKLNPHIGHPSERIDNAHEYHIQRTPFTILYRVRGEDIEFLRVFDGRSNF